jgi:DNA-binding GntR family transcriptional regulator
VIHAEHRLMIDALRRRDADGAAHILFEHIRRTRFELERNKDVFRAPESPRRRKKKAQRG